MSSKAAYGPQPLERDLLGELAELRSRLDAALQQNANELNIMRDRCLALERTMRSIGTPAANPRGRAEARQLLSRLTKRELEVLKAIAEGDSTKQIAFRLKMTFKTTVSHRTRLMKKLDLHETASLVRLALSAGVVPIHSEPDESGSRTQIHAVKRENRSS
jgi:DNA-binding NarL/FixJ family response regulator